MNPAPVNRSPSVYVIRDVESPQLGNVRDLFVYLPPSYARAPARRYPVFYIQDGQNLFDEALAFQGEWGVDETMDALSRVGLEAIVVGVPNMGAARVDEYSPFRDARQGGGRGDAYVEFLASTVKGRIDEELRTRRERDSTVVMGSSMGGLIGLYAYFRRPDVFGAVGAMSPSLWFARRRIFSYVERASSPRGRLYLDIGTAEGDRAVSDARRMSALLERKGYRVGEDLLFVEAAQAPHNEQAWRDRLRKPLLFLMPL